MEFIDLGVDAVAEAVAIPNLLNVPAGIGHDLDPVAPAGGRMPALADRIRGHFESLAGTCAERGREAEQRH